MLYKIQAKAVKTGPTWRSVLALIPLPSQRRESDHIFSTSINTTLKLNNPDKIEETQSRSKASHSPHDMHLVKATADVVN